MVVSECCSVLDLGLDETVELLNRGFSDYIVPVQFDLAGWLHMVVGDGIDLGLSRVLVRDGMPVGCARSRNGGGAVVWRRWRSCPRQEAKVSGGR